MKWREAQISLALNGAREEDVIQFGGGIIKTHKKI